MIFRRRGGSDRFVLSGFATADDYESRVPTWESDEEYPDVESATLAAQVWQAGSGPAAVVEVIRLRGNEGQVEAVVDSSGTERI